MMTLSNWDEATALIQKLAELPAKTYGLNAMLERYAYTLETEYYTRTASYDQVTVTEAAGKWYLPDSLGGAEVPRSKVSTRRYVADLKTPAVILSTADWDTLRDQWEALLQTPDTVTTNSISLLLLTDTWLTGALLTPKWQGRLEGEQSAIPLNNNEVAELHAIYATATETEVNSGLVYGELTKVLTGLHPNQYSTIL